VRQELETCASTSKVVATTSPALNPPRPSRRDTLVEAQLFYKVKRIWIATYRNTSSIIEADRAAGRSLVPTREMHRLPEKLAFLRANDLSFFADRE
jgi:hypothetical protein